MRSLLLFLIGGCSCALFGLPLRAIEAKMEGLTMPFFAPDGRLTHKLVSAHATVHGDTRTLNDVEILYFAQDDPTKVIERVTAANAVWSEQNETLTGTGAVAIATDTTQLSGEGFDFSLRTSVLHIQRNFRLSNPQCVLTGDRATADLVIARAGEDLKLRDIRRCEAEGHLHLVMLQKKPDAMFDEAFTDYAVYDGTTHVLTLPHGADTVSGNARGHTNHATIDLSSEAAAAKKPGN